MQALGSSFLTDYTPKISMDIEWIEVLMKCMYWNWSKSPRSQKHLWDSKYIKVGSKRLIPQSFGDAVVLVDIVYYRHNTQIGGWFEIT